MFEEAFNPEKYEWVEIRGAMVGFPPPDKIPDFHVVEREDLIEKALAAWKPLDGLPPLNFRLYGPPGGGKNALVYGLAQILHKPLYIQLGHEVQDPRDLACTPQMTRRGDIVYTAKAIFAAMLKGGICFFDELDKATESALHPLASVLDDRRSLDVDQVGIRIKAHEDFLFCASSNEDEEVGPGLPGFIDERTRPAFYVGYPDYRTLEKILRSHLPMAADIWFRVFLEEFGNEQVCPRVSRELLTFAYRLSPGGKAVVSEADVRACLEKAKEDVDLRERKKKSEPESDEIQGEDWEGKDVGIRLLFPKDETVH